MQNIVIFGHTDFSELVGWYVEHEERYRLLGYTVNEKYLDNGQLSNSGGGTAV
ncbi:hypothetical protein [uncultured Selenomonas sp.]|uniref:hypothetical protein n=1 Tax=uncultured Selenomonas sp. TaxID=159275 RepID=UPI0025EBE5F0|nr:hypothetical protein [uncultured Selenomonas sp.]